MCGGCWEKYGRADPTEAARAIGLLLRDVDPYGGCHIVRADWNVEDGNIDFCIGYRTTTDAEREVLRQLKTLTIDQRASAMAVADGYV